jgi:hypothetical protein
LAVVGVALVALAARPSDAYLIRIRPEPNPVGHDADLDVREPDQLFSADKSLDDVAKFNDHRINDPAEHYIPQHDARDGFFDQDVRPICIHKFATPHHDA